MRTVAAAALALASACPAWAAEGSEPSVRIAGTQPLLVRGVRFEAGERVRVVVRVDEARSVRRVIASDAGRFRVRFAQTFVDRCASVRVRAIGDEGSRAAAKLPQPMCPPA